MRTGRSCRGAKLSSCRAGSEQRNSSLSKEGRKGAASLQHNFTRCGMITSCIGQLRVTGAAGEANLKNTDVLGLQSWLCVPHLWAAAPGREGSDPWAAAGAVLSSSVAIGTNRGYTSVGRLRGLCRLGASGSQGWRNSTGAVCAQWKF